MIRLKEKIYDTIVIGAGQAGLAAGYWLRNTGLDFLILEAGPSPAGSWPKYYESLLLFTPEFYSQLPGLRIGGNPKHYPSRNDMITYLKKYAEHFCLPVCVDTEVLHVEKSDIGFTLKTSGDNYQARTIINATGSYNHPNVPHLPGQEIFTGKIIHSLYYRNTEEFKGLSVVIVGAGNSAIQIADELKDVARVTLTSRRPIKWLSQRILGKDIHWWMGITGIDTLPLRKKPKSPLPVLDTGKYRRALQYGAFDWKPLFRTLTTDGVIWSDGTTGLVDVLILATGFINNPKWLSPLNIFDSNGEMKQIRGVFTNVPGLFSTGFFLQRTPASGNIRGASFDAEYIVRRLLVHLKRRSRKNWLDIFLVNWRQRWRKMESSIIQHKIDRNKILTRLQLLDPISNGPKLVFPEEQKSFTIRELLSEISWFHTFLKEKDVTPGEIVAVMSGNNSGMTVAIIGIVTYGAVFMPLNPSLTKTEKQKLLSHANPRLLLTQAENDKELWSSSCQLPSPGKIIEHDSVSTYQSCPQGGFLNYTSGTTGMPKGIFLSEAQVIYNLDEVQKILKKNHEHVAACFLPLFHMFGVMSDLLLTLLNGGKVILLPEFDLARVPEIVRAIREYEVNTFSAVPLMYDLFIRMNAEIPCSQLSLCISGGAPLREELRTQFYNKFGTEIVPAYGVTEAVCFCLCSLPGSTVSGSAGKPVGIDIQIIDEGGKELPLNQIGELIISGPSVITSGYYEDNRECYITIGEKKWFRTGDVGWCDVEGNFFITGRLKNMVIKGGSKIYLEDIDDCLKKHPQIKDAASMRLEFSGTTEIEQFVTFISVNDKTGLEITDAWVKDYISNLLGRQKLPDRITIINSIPRTMTGKIKYQQLINLAIENGF